MNNSVTTIIENEVLNVAVADENVNVAITNVQIGTFPVVVRLVDAPTLLTDASRGNTFLVSIATDRILGIPTNVQDSLRRVWRIFNADTNAHYITLPTTAGGFRLDSAKPNPYPIGAGQWLWLGGIYNLEDNHWHIVGDKII